MTEKQGHMVEAPPPYTQNAPPPYTDQTQNPGYPVQGGYNQPSTYAHHVSPPAGQLQSPPLVAPTGYFPVPQGVPPQGTVYTQPTTIVAVMPVTLRNPPQDYLAYSIMVTILCCWPIGIVAILKSVGCRDAIRRGNEAEAIIFSQQARRNANIALGVGILFFGVICSLYYVLRLAMF